jgi:hypothetical protein
MTMLEDVMSRKIEFKEERFSDLFLQLGFCRINAYCWYVLYLKNESVLSIAKFDGDGRFAKRFIADEKHKISKIVDKKVLDFVYGLIGV